MTGGAGRIGPVFAEKDPVMDLISFPFHPIEEALKTDEFSFSINEDLLLLGKEFFKRFLNRDSVPPAGLKEIVIKILMPGCVPGSEWPLLQCLFGVWNHLLPIDSNDPAKTLAGGAGADRAVK